MSAVESVVMEELAGPRDAAARDLQRQVQEVVAQLQSEAWIDSSLRGFPRDTPPLSDTALTPLAMLHPLVAQQLALPLRQVLRAVATNLAPIETTAASLRATAGNLTMMNDLRQAASRDLAQRWTGEDADAFYASAGELTLNFGTGALITTGISVAAREGDALVAMARAVIARLVSTVVRAATQWAATTGQAALARNCLHDIATFARIQLERVAPRITAIVTATAASGRSLITMVNQLGSLARDLRLLAVGASGADDGLLMAGGGAGEKGLAKSGKFGGWKVVSASDGKVRALLVAQALAMIAHGRADSPISGDASIPKPSPAVRQAVTLLLQDITEDPSRVDVAINGAGFPVGAGGYYVHEGRGIEVTSLVSFTAGQGVGSSLLKSLWSHAVAENPSAPRMMLQSDPSAMGFYSKLGGTVTVERGIAYVEFHSAPGKSKF